MILYKLTMIVLHRLTVCKTWDGEISMQSRGRPWIGLVTSGFVVQRDPTAPAEVAEQHCTPSPTPDPVDLAGGSVVHALWGPHVGEELWCCMRNMYEGNCSHETKEAVV